MALAILRQSEPHRQAIVLDLEAGENRYFRLWVGPKDRVEEDGFFRMEQPIKQTPIMGPLPEHAMGRTQVPVPRTWFDRKNRYVQIATYRDKQGAGAAWSEIVPVLGFTDNSGDDLLPLNLPVLAMSLPATHNAPFRYKELSLSRQQSLTDLLQGLLPQLLGVAGKAVEKTAEKNPKLKATTDQASNLLQSDALQQLLAALLSAALPGKPAQSQAKSLSLPNGYASQMAIPIPIIDALLKAVPALAPVLQSAVQGLTDPQFIDAIGRNSPVTKILESGTGIVRDVLGLNVDIDTSVEDMTKFGADMNSLLATMLKQNQIPSTAQSLRPMQSVSLSTATNDQLKASGIDFLPVQQVMLSLGLQTQGELLADMASLYFAQGREIRLPLRISTPKPIAKAWLFVGFRAVDGQRWIIRKKWKVEGAQGGQLAVVPNFSPDELRQLEPNTEYTLSFRMIWPNKRGQRVGTSLSRIVKFVAPLAYDQVRESGEQPIPLNDIGKFREFWHKVWGKQLTKDFRDIDLDCKYYVTMSTGTGPNHRLETLTQFEAGRTGKQQGKLKSGMEWGLDSLSALIPLISDKPALTPAEKAALSNTGFAHRFTHVARMKVDFWGLENESVALWTYPEVQMHEVVLKTPLEVDENGMVKVMGEKIIHLPIPSQIHFIGAKL